MPDKKPEPNDAPFLESAEWRKLAGEVPVSENAERERMTTVTLPIKYGLLVLGTLSASCQDMAPLLERMKAEGKTENDLDERQIRLLVCPIFARAAVAEMLADEGVLTTQGREKLGFALLARIQSAQER